MRIQKVLLPAVVALMTTVGASVAAAQNTKPKMDTVEITKKEAVMPAENEKKDNHKLYAGLGIAFIIAMAGVGFLPSVFKIIGEEVEKFHAKRNNK